MFKTLFKSKKTLVISAIALILIIAIVGTMIYFNSKNTSSTVNLKSSYSNDFIGITEGEKVSGNLKVIFDADPAKTEKVVFYVNDQKFSTEVEPIYAMSGGNTEKEAGTYNSLSFKDGGNYSIAAEVFSKDGSKFTKKVNFTVANSEKMIQGLKASYFANKELTGNPKVQIDPNINFEWGTTLSDYTSVRWEGFIKPKFSEKYVITTESDDGIRVWLNGEKVIDNWTIHPVQANSSPVYLEGGRYFDIRVEYFEEKTNSLAKLYWTSPSQTKEIVPANALYHLNN